MNKDWLDASTEAIRQLKMILDRYEKARKDLITQSTQRQSANDSSDISQMGFTPENDTTHHLVNDDAFLNLINPLATMAGVKAIKDNIDATKRVIANLEELSEVFEGRGKWTAEQAWTYLESVNTYLDNDRRNQESVRRAGYRS